MDESYERFLTRFPAPQLSAKQAWETIDLMETVMHPVSSLPPIERKSGNKKGGLLDLQSVLVAAQDEESDAEDALEKGNGKVTEEEEESPVEDEEKMEDAVLELLESTMSAQEAENQISTEVVIPEQQMPPSIQGDVLYPYPGEVDDPDRFYSTEIALGTKCLIAAEEAEPALTEEAINVINSKREYYQKERAESDLRL